jgi:hypothetical protein
MEYKFVEKIKSALYKFTLFILCALLFVIVFLLWLYFPIWIKYDSMFGDILVGKVFAPSLGEFGDVYGSLNTLFSGFAFSGVIITILMQSADLRSTREEMKGQGLQFKQQTEAMQKQVFESSFFSMMNLHNTISSDLRNKNKFEKLFINLIDIARNPGCRDNKMSEHLSKIYRVFMKREYSSIGHYFRYIYQVMKFIHSSGLEKDDKFVYMNILRAQLSNYELVLLFVNCQCYERSEKFKKLVEEYAFFEHIYDADLNSLLTEMNECKGLDEPYQLGELKMLYSPKAFGLECHEG